MIFRRDWDFSNKRVLFVFVGNTIFVIRILRTMWNNSRPSRGRPSPPRGIWRAYVSPHRVICPFFNKLQMLGDEFGEWALLGLPHGYMTQQKTRLVFVLFCFVKECSCVQSWMGFVPMLETFRTCGYITYTLIKHSHSCQHGDVFAWKREGNKWIRSVPLFFPRFM